MKKSQNLVELKLCTNRQQFPSILCWKVYTTQSPVGPPKNLYVLHNSEYPATVFSVLDSGSLRSNSILYWNQHWFRIELFLQLPLLALNFSCSGNKCTTLTSDTLFDLLMLKLSNAYQKKVKIESKGPRFEIKDFLVKLGSVTSQGAFKVGHILRFSLLFTLIPMLNENYNVIPPPNEVQLDSSITGHSGWSRIRPRKVSSSTIIAHLP